MFGKKVVQSLKLTFKAYNFGEGGGTGDQDGEHM